MASVALTTIPFLLSAREKTQTLIHEVNQKCKGMNLPHAFETEGAETSQLVSQSLLQGNPDYRFEGFGLVIGFRPKISFWVHYKKDTPEHQEVGRFLMDLNILQELGFNFFPTQTIEKVSDFLEDA